MSSSVPINSKFKKFIILYFSAVFLSILVMSLVFGIYMSYLSSVIKDLSRNPVMIHDSFALRQSIIPLIRGDILGIQISDSNRNIVFQHSQDKKKFFSLGKNYDIIERNSLLYGIRLDMNFEKYILILLAISILSLFLYYPFIRFEEREFQNQSNQLMADLSKKLAHDIRTPISTLNLISSKISDLNIRDLQHAVIKQINLISEDLLNPSKSIQGLNDHTQQSYSDLIYQIKQEYELKLDLKILEIVFNIDRELETIPATHSKVIYSVLCNAINNSVEAINKESNRIQIDATKNLDQIQFKVRDNGIGIPKDILSKLGRQTVSYGKQARSFSGNGIALVNATKDIENIGGFLAIISTLNEFTEVEINIPAK